MTMRDVQWSFSDIATQATYSIVGAAGTFTFPNSLDTAPLGGYLTELVAGDTQLTANVNAYRDLGGGERLWLCIDCTQTVNTLTNVTFNLVTSATSALGAPVTMYTSGAIAIGNAALNAGGRTIAALPRATTWLEYLGLTAVTTGATGTTGAFVAWIGWDLDAVDLGGASGFSIK